MENRTNDDSRRQAKLAAELDAATLPFREQAMTPEVRRQIEHATEEVMRANPGVSLPLSEQSRKLAATLFPGTRIIADE